MCLIVRPRSSCLLLALHSRHQSPTCRQPSISKLHTYHFICAATWTQFSQFQCVAIFPSAQVLNPVIGSDLFFNKCKTISPISFSSPLVSTLENPAPANFKYVSHSRTYLATPLIHTNFPLNPVRLPSTTGQPHERENLSLTTPTISSLTEAHYTGRQPLSPRSSSPLNHLQGNYWRGNQKYHHNPCGVPLMSNCLMKALNYP